MTLGVLAAVGAVPSVQGRALRRLRLPRTRTTGKERNPTPGTVEERLSRPAIQLRLQVVSDSVKALGKNVPVEQAARGQTLIELFEVIAVLLAVSVSGNKILRTVEHGPRSLFVAKKTGKNRSKLLTVLAKSLG
jgi:hypothetical protein